MLAVDKNKKVFHEFIIDIVQLIINSKADQPPSAALAKDHSEKLEKYGSLFIDIFLDISQINGSSSVLVTGSDEQNSSFAVKDDDLIVNASGRIFRKQIIILETWQLTLLKEYANDNIISSVEQKEYFEFITKLDQFLQNMPSSELCQKLKSNPSDIFICHRSSSTRMQSVLDCGLDFLHESTNGFAIEEKDFKPIQTELGFRVNN